MLPEAEIAREIGCPAEHGLPIPSAVQFLTAGAIRNPHRMSFLRPATPYWNTICSEFLR